MSRAFRTRGNFGDALEAVERGEKGVRVGVNVEVSGSDVSRTQEKLMVGGRRRLNADLTPSNDGRRERFRSRNAKKEQPFELP